MAASSTCSRPDSGARSTSPPESSRDSWPSSPERTASCTASSALSSRNATQRGFGTSGKIRSITGTRPAIACSTRVACRAMWICCPERAPVATSWTASISSSIPRFSRATPWTTGTPSSFSNFLASIAIPCRRASSMRLRKTTTLSVISLIWSTRFRFRSRRVASTTTTVTSGRPNRTKSRATSSSTLPACSEYVPGRSTTFTRSPS